MFALTDLLEWFSDSVENQTFKLSGNWRLGSHLHFDNKQDNLANNIYYNLNLRHLTLTVLEGFW